jgi:hypothetical protein
LQREKLRTDFKEDLEEVRRQDDAGMGEVYQLVEIVADSVNGGDREPGVRDARHGLHAEDKLADESGRR